MRRAILVSWLVPFYNFMRPQRWSRHRCAPATSLRAARSYRRSGSTAARSASRSPVGFHRYQDRDAYRSTLHRRHRDRRDARWYQAWRTSSCGLGFVERARRAGERFADGVWIEGTGTHCDVLIGAQEIECAGTCIEAFGQQALHVLYDIDSMARFNIGTGRHNQHKLCLRMQMLQRGERIERFTKQHARKRRPYLLQEPPIASINQHRRVRSHRAGHERAIEDI